MSTVRELREAIKHMSDDDPIVWGFWDSENIKEEAFNWDVELSKENIEEILLKLSNIDMFPTWIDVSCVVRECAQEKEEGK